MLLLFPVFGYCKPNINNIVFPHISSPELEIISPANKTYTKPMRGYFPATCGFENYADGTTGLDIEFLDEYSGLGSGLNTDIRIAEDLLDGHHNYLYIRDSQSDNNTWAVHQFNENQSIGTVEFFNRFDNNLAGSAIRREYLYFRASNNTIAFRMQINHHNGDLRYYTGSSYELICNVDANTWYHHKILFNCNDGINGTLTWIVKEEDGIEISRVSNINFENDFNGITIDEIYFETQEEDYGLESMWDAFGYSWDTNYFTGINLNEGLLLSFTDTFNFTWIGYSLDGNTNKTIFGTTTITLPENGKHTIQLFGTVSNGTLYQSDLIYFSVNTNLSGQPGLDIIFIPIIIILSTVGISGTSYIIINYEKKKKVQIKSKRVKEVRMKSALKTRSIKEAKKAPQIRPTEKKLDIEALSPIPQEISLVEDNYGLLDDEYEEYNLKLLKDLCNEWINQCAMHKESFEGLGYSCFNCHTNYCVKCAYTLAEKNIGCIVCGKLIPIKFQKKKPIPIPKNETEKVHDIKHSLKNIFESDDLLVRINQLDDINLTFFEKDFFIEIEKVDLNENEKQLLIKEMQALTPKERKAIINKILNEPNTSKVSNDKLNDFKYIIQRNKLIEIFKSENLLENIKQFRKIALTFLEKDFFKKVEELNLDQKSKQAFVKDMLSLTPKERNQLIEKLKKNKE